VSGGRGKAASFEPGQCFHHWRSFFHFVSPVCPVAEMNHALLLSFTLFTSKGSIVGGCTRGQTPSAAGYQRLPRKGKPGSLGYPRRTLILVVLWLLERWPLFFLFYRSSFLFETLIARANKNERANAALSCSSSDVCLACAHQVLG
jgi:hypothetical protein